MTLEESLGFSKNPFFKRTSEQELSFLDEIFFEPSYYQTLMDVLSSGDSRFIIGQRGHGKSSIINKLVHDLEESNLFVIKIDRFDSIPVKRNETALLNLILKTIITKLAIFLNKNNHLVKKFNIHDKEKLALFIRMYFRVLSQSEYNEIYGNIHKIKTKNWFIRLFNTLGIGVANKATSAAISITSTAISQSLGLQDIQTNTVYKEYFGKLNVIDNNTIDTEQQNYSKSELKNMLDEVLNLVSTSGFQSTVVLFDKIDEYQELGADITRIGNFTKEILSDTELLLNERFAIGFSLWSELKSELSGTVRFDKFGVIDVRWKPQELIPLINKRIKYYSIKKQMTFDKLIKHENDRKELIHVANKSPRDLISVLHEIYQIQVNTNSNVKFIDADIVTKGLINFCSNYDFDSMVPSNSSRSKEVKAMINRILKVRLSRFTLKQVTDTFGQSSSQSEGQVKLMIKYKLIREDDILGPNSIKYYEVIDPKVEYLIRRGITEIE